MALSIAIECFGDVRGREVFGRNLRHYRLKAGLSQEGLAALLDVNPARVSDWERGIHGCSIDVIDRIASVLGLRMTALVDEMTPQTDAKQAPRKSEAARLPRPRAKKRITK